MLPSAVFAFALVLPSPQGIAPPAAEAMEAAPSRIPEIRWSASPSSPSLPVSFTVAVPFAPAFARDLVFTLETARTVRSLDFSAL